MTTDQPNAADEHDGDELRLAPSDGMSESERLTRSRSYSPFVKETRTHRGRLQFTVASLMVVSLFICVGLAGANWMPAPFFAGIVGVLTLFTLGWTSAETRESDIPRPAWIGIILAYVAASVIALIRMAS